MGHADPRSLVAWQITAAKADKKVTGTAWWPSWIPAEGDPGMQRTGSAEKATAFADEKSTAPSGALVT